jgi:selenocysteine-specific elongation factor
VLDPDLAAEEALTQIARTSLGDVPWVAVSAKTGAGLTDLRDELHRLVARLPDGDPRRRCGCGWTAASPSAVPASWSPGRSPRGTVRVGDADRARPHRRPFRGARAAVAEPPRGRGVRGGPGGA